MKIGNSASSFYNVNNDNFNRANTTGSLGNSDRGLPWDNVRQTWEVLSNNAYTSATQNQYALAVGNVGISNINSNISIPGSGAGAGLAFWVVDQNNWYAAFPYYTQVTGTTCTGSASYCYSAGCTPSGCGGCGVTNATYSTCSSGPFTSSSCPGGACSCSYNSPQCNGGTATCTGVGCSPSGCCSGISYSTAASTCTGAVSSCYDSTNTCTPSGCGSCSISSSMYSACNGVNATCYSTSGNCTPAGTSGCGATCSSKTVYSYSCDFPGQVTTWNGTSNCTAPANPTCSYGGQVFSYTCTTCTAPTIQTSFTRSCNTLVAGVTTGSCTTLGSGSWTYYNSVTNYQYYCNPPVTGTTTLYNFTLIKMVGGSLSTIATYSCPSAILGLRVQTNGNAITITGYSDTGLTTQTCQQTYTESSPNRGGKIGLLYGETPALGSSTLDNFRVE